MSDNSEIYILEQQFFSGDFKAVIEHSRESFTEDSIDKFLEYYYRAKISLSLFDEVLEELKQEDNETIKVVFQNFTNCLQGGEEIESFTTYIEENYQSNDLVLKIGCLYFVKLGQLEKAISMIEESNTEELEILSLSVLFKIYSNNITKAGQELSNLKKISNDSIIFNLIESFYNSINGNYQSSFYFFEEIEQQYPNFLSRLQLLVLNLQLLQIPETQEILNGLTTEEVNELNSGDLIANKICFNVLNNTASDENDNLIKELQAKNPNHVFLLDHAEKNAMFDEIVNRYKH